MRSGDPQPNGGVRKRVVLRRMFWPVASLAAKATRLTTPAAGRSAARNWPLNSRIYRSGRQRSCASPTTQPHERSSTTSPRVV